jgi:hypothetical protein
MTNYNTHENNPYYSGIEYLNTNREIFFSTIRNMQYFGKNIGKYGLENTLKNQILMYCNYN